MRINLHQHTKRTKKSEPETRNLDINNEKDINLFINNLKDWDVGIVAITNHNFFDKKSFDILEERCKKEGILLLPGIEIDILDSNSKAHNLGIIVSNYKKDEWNEICSEFLTSDKYCDKFAIKLPDLIKKIESLEKIFLVPNKQKSNNNLELSLGDLKIIQNDKNGIWFFETTNKISSHILSYKGKRTFYGSDEKDIFNPKYKELPDSKIKIDSFANLLKFLNKDLFFLRKEMEEKVLMEIEVCPKKWSEKQKFPIFKDVNVIIGPRGVGKSELFKEIKTKINERSSKEYVSYEQNNNNYNQILNEITSKFQCTIDFQNEIHDLNSIFTIKTKSSFNFNEILKNFLSIGKFYKNQKITTYDAWTKIEFSSNLIKNTSDYNYFNNFYSDIKIDILNLRKTLKIIELNKNQSNFLIDNYILVKNYINKIIELKVEELKKLFIKNKSFNITKNVIENIKSLIENMTSKKSMTSELGFVHMFKLRERLHKSIEKILNFQKTSTNKQILGDVLNNKTLYLKREFYYPAEKVEGYKNMGSLNFKKYQSIRKLLLEINENIWKNSLQTKINKLIKYLNVEEINSLQKDDFIWYKDIIQDQNGNEHNPSPGEQAILKLNNYLELEQDCYFLDEPENGLDNHFINEIIVQKINKLARDGKVVIIVTHNANIGVRTLPYLTIYRELNKNQNTENKTYLGNSFKETMHNIQNEETDFIWADICEKILEGGEEAFNDRSNYYGK